MNEIFQSLISSAAQQCFSVLLLLGGLIWMNSRLEKLDGKIRECEEDREKLWDRLLMQIED
jgi:hypothetical protein